MSDAYAIIESGVVANVVVWDGDVKTWSPPEGTTAVIIPDGIALCVGWSYDGISFQSPAPVQDSNDLEASDHDD